MPDHVHVVLVPQDATTLSDCLRETHRRYTRAINLRERWHGYLWQGRFLRWAIAETRRRATPNAGRRRGSFRLSERQPRIG